MPDDRERRVRGARELLTGLRGARSGAAVRRVERLDTPVDLRRPLLGRGYDPETLGRASERVARFLGTGRFIIYMTVFVGVWLGWNSLAPRGVEFDPHGMNFTLLTLLLSLQASYAAPLILLAQNRQDDRDRVNLDADRRNQAQLRADLDFVSREVASLRMAVGEIATRDYVRSEVRQLTDTLTDLLGLDEEARTAQAELARRQAKKADKAEKARQEKVTAARAAKAAAAAEALGDAASRVQVTAGGPRDGAAGSAGAGERGPAEHATDRDGTDADSGQRVLGGRR